MSDPNVPPPPPPVHPPLPPPQGRGLGWFFAISGSIVLLLTLGCILAVTEGNPANEMGGVAILCGSPTLILGGVFLWLGSRRLKR
jgi:peptidoglycan/LPS O-acetylase OafA/YrhL